MSTDQTDRAKEILEQACSYYCGWYDGTSATVPGRNAADVAYSMVSFCRMALAELNGEAVDNAIL